MLFKFDIVTCVSDSHLEIAIKSIRSLIKFSGAERYFIIASRENNNFIKKNFSNKNNLIYLEENEIFKNFRKVDIAKIIKSKGGDPTRAGWYFQQFLKMEVAMKDYISDHYLIWDCDTIMLKKINFFNKKGQTIINTSNQYHKPYFEFINRLGLKSRKQYSFICEHMMINSKIMRELIKFIGKIETTDILWVKKVLNNVNKIYLSKSGFSEFETYGIFLSEFYQHTFSVRNLKSTRKGYTLFGNPNSKKTFLILLIYGYYWATFEIWDKKSKRNLIKKFIFSRIKSFNLRLCDLYIFFMKLINPKNRMIEISNYLSKK